MKLKSTLLLFFLIPAFVFAQETDKKEHFIEVTGTAELEIEPNEIYVIVRLREFEESRQKVMLEKIDKEFLDAVEAAGINGNQLELADAGVQLGRLLRRQKDIFREKTYQIKLTSAAEVEKFISKIESVKIDYADIARLSHSELEKMKLDLKVKALQAAKTKAEALVKAVGSELGKPLVIREVDFAPYIPTANERYDKYKATGAIMRSMDNQQSSYSEPEISFKKIKLQAQINAQFEIK